MRRVVKDREVEYALVIRYWAFQNKALIIAWKSMPEPTFRSLGNGFLEYWSNILICAFYT